MRKIYLLLITVLINISIFPGYCDAEKKLLCEEFANDNDHNPFRFLPFKMALPENFVFHQLEESYWILFGEKNTLIDIDNQFSKNPDSPLLPLTGVIRMKLSYNTSQNEVFFGNDDELKEQIKKMGGTKLCIRELAWGEYPLKIVEATIKGAPFRMGWIGLNCEGPVLCINYMFPQGKKSYLHDFAIWDRFLNETKERSREDLEDLYQQEMLSEGELNTQ